MDLETKAVIPSPSPPCDEGSSSPEKVSNPVDESRGVSDIMKNGQEESATESKDPPPVIRSTQDDGNPNSGGDSRRYSEENSPGSSPTQSAEEKRAKANTALFNAIISDNPDNLNAVREAIKSGADGKATEWTETAVHFACRRGNKPIVEELLKDKVNLQCLAEVDDDGWTPLISACSENRPGTKEIVELLLSHGNQFEIEARSSIGWTALHMACWESSEEVVQLLLDRKAKVNVNDRRNSTPLTLACERSTTGSVRSLLGKGAECDVVDDDGDTPLILASRYGDPDMVREILAQNPDSLYRENKSGKDALGSAILNLDARDLTIPLLLDKGFKIVGDDAVRKLVEDMLKPPDAQFAGTTRAAIKAILEHSSKADRVSVILHVDDQHFELLWELKNDLGVNHDICKIIRKWRSGSPNDELRKSMLRLDSSKEMERSKPESPLQLSAFYGEHVLVWYLLKESQSENKEDINKALGIAAARKKGRRTKIASESDKKGKKPDRAKDSEKHKVDEHSKRFDYTIDILSNATQLVIPKRQIIRPDRAGIHGLESLLHRHSATIVSLYEKDGQNDLCLSSSSIFDLVYADDGEGVHAVMERGRSILDVTKISSDEEVSTNDLRLRWVHLPANNMDWMEHLTVRIYDEMHGDNKKSSIGNESGDDDYLMSFMDLARRSRNELPTDESDVKFMEPLCLREDDGINGLEKTKKPWETSPKDAAVAPRRLALYIPYLTFGYCYPPERKALNPRNADLVEKYKGRILHGSRSLDRFYYNALPSDEMNYRDMSQVVTRRLLNLEVGDPLPNKIHGWPYLTVDQLWVWVIDEKTIISSSTHREDEFDNLLVDNVWHGLLQASQRRFGENLPSTVTEMSQFLISTCIGFINNSTWNKVCHEPESRSETSRSKRDAMSKSILLLYAESINEVATREKSLYKSYQERIAEEKIQAGRESAAKALENKIKGQSKTQLGVAEISRYLEDRERNKKDWQDINHAATLLAEVKDIRDELTILRSLVAQQQRVWSGLTGADQEFSGERNANFAANELINMVEQTDAIQKSINYFINIKQSMMSHDMAEKSADQSRMLVELSLAAEEESAENTRQGKILYAFGFVTVVFTPLSFLTSFLALNTSTSRHNDEGELEYEASWMNRIIFGISAAIVGPFLIYAFSGGIEQGLVWLKDYMTCLEMKENPEGLTSSPPSIWRRIKYMNTRITKNAREDAKSDLEKGKPAGNNIPETHSIPQTKDIAG